MTPILISILFSVTISVFYLLLWVVPYHKVSWIVSYQFWIKLILGCLFAYMAVPSLLVFLYSICTDIYVPIAMIESTLVSQVLLLLVSVGSQPLQLEKELLNIFKNGTRKNFIIAIYPITLLPLILVGSVYLGLEEDRIIVKNSVLQSEMQFRMDEILSVNLTEETKSQKGRGGDTSKFYKVLLYLSLKNGEKIEILETNSLWISQVPRFSNLVSLFTNHKIYYDNWLTLSPDSKDFSDAFETQCKAKGCKTLQDSVKDLLSP
jgi:hypothetical protein